MFPELTELLLIGCSIELIWTQIQIKYIDTKNQLADILTKGNFTRDEWNHLLTLFNISHFSSTACIAAVAKRAQQESGEGRVTAKSRPMMNLTSRTPSFVSSSGLIKPGEDLVWDIKILENLFQVTIDRGNLRKILGIHGKKLALIVRNLFSAGMRILQGTGETCVREFPRTGLF